MLRTFPHLNPHQLLCSRHEVGTNQISIRYRNLKFLRNDCSITATKMANDDLVIQFKDPNLQSRGALGVLEGLDGSGKSSQCSEIFAHLQSRGYATELWRFPDRTTVVGHMISAYLSNESNLDNHTIHLLFSANRWEKRSLMEEKLKAGTTLIVDRYSYSGVAFSSAKGLDFNWCKAPEMGLLAPDLVLYLDITPEKAAERGGYGGERYEHLEFQRKVREKYLALQDASWKIVDACLTMEEVQKNLREYVLECVEACQKGKPLSPLQLC